MRNKRRRATVRLTREQREWLACGTLLGASVNAFEGGLEEAEDAYWANREALLDESMPLHRPHAFWLFEFEGVEGRDRLDVLEDRGELSPRELKMRREQERLGPRAKDSAIDYTEVTTEP